MSEIIVRFTEPVHFDRLDNLAGLVAQHLAPIVRDVHYEVEHDGIEDGLDATPPVTVGEPMIADADEHER